MRTLLRQCTADARWDNGTCTLLPYATHILQHTTGNTAFSLVVVAQWRSKSNTKFMIASLFFFPFRHNHNKSNFHVCPLARSCSSYNCTRVGIYYVYCCNSTAVQRWPFMYVMRTSVRGRPNTSPASRSVDSSPAQEPLENLSCRPPNLQL